MVCIDADYGRQKKTTTIMELFREYGIEKNVLKNLGLLTLCKWNIDWIATNANTHTSAQTVHTEIYQRVTNMNGKNMEKTEQTHSHQTPSKRFCILTFLHLDISWRIWIRFLQIVFTQNVHFIVYRPCDSLKQHDHFCRHGFTAFGDIFSTIDICVVTETGEKFPYSRPCKDERMTIVMKLLHF